jgi:hypothetical protein
MDRNHLFSMALAAATMGLTACGGSDGVATTPGTGGTTTATVTPATVACEAPSQSEFANYTGLASVCIPADTGGGSSRYDLQSYNATSGGQVVKVDFSNATCTGNAGVAVATASIQNKTFASNTTTVAALGADGITPTTGSVRTVSFTISNVTGTFPAGVPLLSSGVYALCKTTPPSTTATRTIESVTGNGFSTSFAPTYVLRVSNVNSAPINTGFGFDGAYFD